MHTRAFSVFAALTLFAGISLFTPKAANAGTYACRWDAVTSKCVVENPVCSDGSQLPGDASTTCGLITVQNRCNDFSYPCRQASFVPPGSCPAQAPTSICTYDDYPKAYPPGVCAQGPDCTDSLDPGSLARQNWFCCNHPASCAAPGGGIGVDTPIGCIPINSPTQTVVFFLRFALGISGGIALILLAIGGVQVATSSGDPKKMMAGKELITSSISGLVLMVFAVIVLHLVGVSILGVPNL